MNDNAFDRPVGRRVRDEVAKAQWRLGPARERAVRVAKRLRSLIVDPLPRSQELVYEGYDLSYPDIAYRFRIRGQTFIHRVAFEDLSRETFAGLGEAGWAPLLHHIGLLFAPYHCRLTDVKRVRSTCSPLPDDLRDFYEAAALGALAELRYRWGLDPRRPLVFRSDVPSQMAAPRPVTGDERVLLLNGGGKDCVVAAELLRAMGMSFAWFTVVRNDAVQKRVIAMSETRESYSATIRFDPAIDRNARYPWGPTVALGALYSSLALVPAILHGFRYVAIANEYSANFPTRVFRGMEINHQYNKSYELETRLIEVINRRLVDGVTCFSVLRPFYELRLGALFSTFDQYLEAFLSCNKGMGKGVWCKACPKCAFVFLILYPFLDASQRERVFGENLFYRAQIRTLILDLVSRGRKPWECVGTSEESQLALLLSLKKSPELTFQEWPYRQDLERACMRLDFQAATATYLQGFHAPHRLPSGFEARLKSVACELAPTDALVPSQP